jgi:uncharacterized iron-regulated membrane protein
MTNRQVHRVLSILVVLVTLYLGVTGSLIELVDFRTLVTHAAPLDPDRMAMREDFAGPPNFRVLGTADNLAATLPGDAQLAPMLAATLRGAQAAHATDDLRYVELRMAGNQPVGQIRNGTQELRFDAHTGAALGATPPVLDEDAPPVSTRNTFKHLHRMTTFGDWALWINVVVAIALIVLIVTGTVVYWQVYKVRRKIKKPNPFWKAGGTWRMLHRSIALGMTLFLTVLVLSGFDLAFESLWFGYYNAHHLTRQPDGRILPGTFAIDASSRLAPDALPRALDRTLEAWRATDPATPIRVIRLRNYGPMAQGVVITGGDSASQVVFDTATGARASLTEPGYPETGFPFGWQAHQWAKSVHRGDCFGLPGRMVSLLAGLAMTYLSVSGIVLYVTMWRKRAGSGRTALFWK